jgi:hypothetical protein
MQELYVYGGQFDNYKNSSAWLSKSLRIGVNHSQMERLTQYYGGLLETEIEASLTVSTPIAEKKPRGRPKKQKEAAKESQDKQTPVALLCGKEDVLVIDKMAENVLVLNKGLKKLEGPEPDDSVTTALLPVVGGEQKRQEIQEVPRAMGAVIEATALQKAAESMKLGLKSGEIVYAMVDGSMLPTREGEDKNDWREVKVGRIFTQSSIHQVDKNHNWIRQSLYVARMDNFLVFIQVMFMALNSFKDLGHNLVFINDGASWIWKWIEKVFAESTQILDFFHAMEYLAKSANILFKDKSECQAWIAKQEAALMQDGVMAFIKELEELSQTVKMTKTQIKELNKITKYFKKHQKRMLYKTFTDRGLLIGSGPIESAHRVILQKRLKQSGQRWSQKGAQNVINLRIQQSNGLWENVVKLIDNQNNTKFANAA